jgi:hypothetical protein
MSKKNQNLFETKCNEAIIFARVSSEKQEKGASAVAFAVSTLSFYYRERLSAILQ